VWAVFEVAVRIKQVLDPILPTEDWIWRDMELCTGRPYRALMRARRARPATRRLPRGLIQPGSRRYESTRMRRAWFPRSEGHTSVDKLCIDRPVLEGACATEHGGLFEWSGVRVLTMSHAVGRKIAVPS
jgi:hypothetical protein